MPRQKKNKVLTLPQAMTRVKAALKDWGSFLGILTDWDIRLKWVSKPEMREGKVSAAASVHWDVNYKSATIYMLEDEFTQTDDQTAESYILHELLHLWYAPVSDRIASLVGQDSGVGNDLGEQEETMVDRLTNQMLRARYGDDYFVDTLDKSRRIS